MVPAPPGATTRPRRRFNAWSRAPGSRPISRSTSSSCLPRWTRSTSLRQISLLQDALWRHAVVATTPVAPPALPPAALAFAQTHGLGPHAHQPTSGLGLDATTLPKARAAHRSPSPQPRVHRTRVDPFAAVWEEVCGWLTAQPERTAKALFHDLQAQYPGQFPDVQLRTL